MEIEVVSDADALAARVAEHVVTALRQAIGARGEACVALSGGGTPARTLRCLAKADVDWSRVRVFQVDERVAPDGHGDRNATMLRRELLDHVPAYALLMPVTTSDLDAAAAAYAAALHERCGGVLDLVHLGIGEDGHTASLVPGDPVLERNDVDVASTGGYRGRRRMTLTYPAIDRARQRLWEVAGRAKADAVRALVERDRSVPAGRVRQEATVLVADEAAAAALPQV